MVGELGQEVVPIAFLRVLFLADGRIVDEMTDPDADAILDRIKSLGG